MSWPYPKCIGIRADGERCQGRANKEGLYCHHHDPARKSPTSTLIASATEINSLGAPGRHMPANRSSISATDHGSVPDKTTLEAFAAEMRRVREAHRLQHICEHVKEVPRTAGAKAHGLT